VLEHFNLTVAPGEVLALVGRSGAGKSTLLKLVNRLLLPDQGEVRVEGRNTREWSPVRLRRRVGYVLQDVGLFPHMTVRDNIGIVPRLEGWPAARIAVRVDELLALIGLDSAGIADRWPDELSGGQRQRVGVARALAVDPPVLLMDEPFGAVDPVARDRLQNEFLRLQEQVRKTIVFVTHDIDEAIKLGDRIAVMREGGHLEQYADPSTLLSAPATDFVASFVGAERTLRRLSVVNVTRDGLVAWPAVPASASLSEAAAAMDRAESDWIVVADDGGVSGWLARGNAAGEGTAAGRAEPVPAVAVGDSLEAALAAILAGNAPGAIITADGQYAGVLATADVVTAARAR
jgi:osmoprotectant transport system ATP-binding protein